MGLLDWAKKPKPAEKPLERPKELSRSDHNISKRRSLPMFASQTHLKDVRDIDFYRQKLLRFLFCPEGREDVRVLRIPFNQLGFDSVTDFISVIPADLFKEYQGQAQPDEGILKDDKVFWIRDGIAEPAVFKWQGIIETEPCMGLQLDRKKAVPYGIHDGKGLFYCKPGHRALVPENEVVPYKKFLRKYLGAPPKKDSLVDFQGSVRLSAKAIAAKNSKPGDRVYLHREKQWATVQWIGKIGNDTVVDLIYERPKPEAGQPVSPDEPTMTRSLSLADFIGELAASEPNTPVAKQDPGVIQTSVEKHPPPTTSATKTSKPEQKQSHVSPPPTPSTRAPPDTDEESEDDSDSTDTDSDETDSETDSEESEDESELDSNSDVEVPPPKPPVESPRPVEQPGPIKLSHQVKQPSPVESPSHVKPSRFVRSRGSMEPRSPVEPSRPVKPPSPVESQHPVKSSLPVEPRSPVEPPSPSESSYTSLSEEHFTPLSSPKTPDLPKEETKVDTSKDSKSIDKSPASPFLPSPKRKGFFRFSSGRKRAQSPSPLYKAEAKAEDMHLLVEAEKTPPPSRPKSQGFFAKFKGGVKAKKEDKWKSKEEVVKKSSSMPSVKKEKSGWAGLFKSKSKTSLHKFSVAPADEPLSPVEPTTPFDEMLPPDQIPTPPPNLLPEGEFNERQIDRPEFLEKVQAKTPTSPPQPPPPPLEDEEDIEKIIEKAPTPPKFDLSDEEDEEEEEHTEQIKTVVPSRHDDTSESEESSSSEEEEESEHEIVEEEEKRVEIVSKVVDPSVETPKFPPTPSKRNTSPEKKNVPGPPPPTATIEATLLTGPQSTNVTIGQDSDNDEEDPPSTPPPSPPVRTTSIGKFKEDRVRNRPSSFGSFLRRIKNQTTFQKKSEAIRPVPPPVPPFTEDQTKIAEDTVPEVTTAPPVENKPEVVGHDNLTRENISVMSDSDISSLQHMETGSNEALFQSNRNLVRQESEAPTVVAETEGNQEGITLELLDEEPPPAITSPRPVKLGDETPKRKKSKPSFTFSFTNKKRKPSRGQVPTTPISTTTQDFQIVPISTDEVINAIPTNVEPENIDPNEEDTQPLVKPPSPVMSDKEDKKAGSKSSSFRDSFKRTFSLTRKRSKKESFDDAGSGVDEDVNGPLSPSVAKPRPVTVYIDNNEVTPKKNSFRKKRPQSLHVDIRPWQSRHGQEGVDIYHSPTETPKSATAIRSPNPALTSKAKDDKDVPKHRIFTTPSFFSKKNKEAVEAKSPPPKSLYKTYNQLEDDSDPEEEMPAPMIVATPPQQVKSTTTPVKPKGPPPPLPTAPPPSLRHQQSFTIPKTETSSDEQGAKLKSALKQRKEIDEIPRGIKIGDRVLWYSGTGPVPGTVQKLFKDGTDKYTAMVKFDRVPVEPLKLTREGDAYIITVEELITPDMFGPAAAITSTSSSPPPEVPASPPPILQSPQSPPPMTPITPSVRFDGVEDKVETPHVLVTEPTFEKDEEELEEEMDLPPPFQEEEVNMACGFKRGIQSRDKSCCLEAILFSLFYTTNAFDIAVLYSNTQNEDAVTRNTRKILRKDIVDPLRREGFCKWTGVQKLRDAVKPLSDEWQTLSTDAEVMMFILFDRALKLGKFISYSNDMSDYLHQLVVDTKDLSRSTTIQHLFQTSLELMDKIKLKTVPTPGLILEMPRSNDALMQYKAVIPNLSLSLSHLLDEGPRLCICGAVATYECTKCTEIAGPMMSIVYCDNCHPTAIAIHHQLTHETQLSPLQQSIIMLDLVAIICVKQGHYFSFVKCGNSKLSPWVYYDGLDQENPKVCIEQNLGMWLDRLETYPGKYTDALQYPLLTHILQDSHICIYQPREKSSSV